MENSTRFSIKKIVFVALFIVGMASLSELHAQCAISDISSSNESVCNDNGTPSNILDDTFTADISVTFSDAPLIGTLDLSGDGIASISVVGLVSPHTFIGVSLPANGNAISLTATFSDEPACTSTDNSVVISPFECSDDACLDVIPPGSPTAALNSADISFNITGSGGASGAILNSISVAGEPNAFTEFYLPTSVDYQFTNPDGANQYIRDVLGIGADIDDGTTVFNPALLETFRDRDLTHYLSGDNAILNTDYVDIFYDAPISAAGNRYVVLTERNGNNRMAIQALDASGSLIGTQVIAETSPGINTYFTTGIPTDFGQDIFVSIFPLTSLISSGQDINGLRLIQIGATSSPTGSDGGDGKAFILYDSSALTPAPTIELTTNGVQPTCPSNEGSITIDATDNGGGTLEFSVNGSIGPWQASNIFNNLPPGTYTPAVRYQSTPTCISISTNSIDLNDACCNPIFSISANNATSCNNNGTDSITTDDFFTADITVTFGSAPSSGTLDLSGDGTASVSAIGLTSPYTFNSVVLPADGDSIDLTASFSSADSFCDLNNPNVLSAPNECSDDSCPDIIPPGNPTAALNSADISFN
ncbi:MAG: hypothetical protein HRU49_09055, partial [Winogradskyella sp.]|uniref:hypothetical protein n=1 Tax=Winogradskyella sp. TaxID=1883156 RepID=UPI0025ED2A86